MCRAPAALSASRRCGGFAFVHLVGRAQAGELGTRGRECVRRAPKRHPPLTASMPPAAKKFFAKVARGLKSACAPRLARKILGRAPVAARIWSEASRSRSNGSARRIRTSGSQNRLPAACSGAARLRRHCRRYRDRRLVECGKLAGSGERILARVQSPPRAWRAPRRLRAGSTRFRARPQRRPPSRSPETGPGRAAELLASNARPRPNRRAGSATAARFNSSSRTVACCARSGARTGRAGRARR